jgi:hypothetical protein
MCLLYSRKVIYKVSATKQSKQTHTKTEQGKRYHLENKYSFDAVMSTMMHGEEIHIYNVILIDINITVDNN